MSEVKEYRILRKSKEGKSRDVLVEAETWEEAEELAAAIGGEVLGEIVGKYAGLAK